MTQPNNALSVAVSKGFRFIDLDGGAVRNGRFFNRFTKTRDRNSPGLYVGLNHATKKWEVHHDNLPN